VRRFEEVVKDTITEEMKTPVISIDADLNLGDLDGDFIRTLKKFEPFGPQNSKPII